MAKAQMQWHPVVHEQWAEERLVFWRLGFNPTYRREEVLEALDVISRRYGITAVTVYEVFGGYDLLWRVWVPKAAVLGEGDRDIKRTLPIFDLEMCDHFEVDSILRHWFWSEREDPSDFERPRSHEVELDPKPAANKLIRINEKLTEYNLGEVDFEAAMADEEIVEFKGRNLLELR